MREIVRGRWLGLLLVALASCVQRAPPITVASPPAMSGVSGWMLLAPPETVTAIADSGPNWQPDSDASLAEWESLHAFNTADECERGKQTFVEQAASGLAATAKANPGDPSKTDGWTILMQHYEAARCVPAAQMAALPPLATGPDAWTLVASSPATANRPVSDWQMFGNYDSAGNCRASRNFVVALAAVQLRKEAQQAQAAGMTVEELEDQTLRQYLAGSISLNEALKLGNRKYNEQMLRARCLLREATQGAGSAPHH